MRIPILLCFALIFYNLSGQIIHVSEDFNTASLPATWTNTATSGTQNWSFGSIGTNNLDGTAMAYFDDDALGASSTNNTFF